MMPISFTVRSNIVSLEHVVLTFSSSFVGITPEQYDDYFNRYLEEEAPVTWPQRGTIIVSLTSPMGTASTLLPRRIGDNFPGNYFEWRFMSVHFWGENPQGEWTAQIQFRDTVGSIEFQVSRVTLYGTPTVPEAVSRIPSQCSAECDSTRGCAAVGAEFCDACAELRVSSTLECVSSCPEGLDERNGYCYNSTLPENACEVEAPSSISATRPFLLCNISLVALIIITLSLLF